MGATGVGWAGAGANTPQRSQRLAEEVARAQAIVVGEVVEAGTIHYEVRLVSNRENDKGLASGKDIDLAVLHPERILKSDSQRMVNKADGSNPVEWMYLAFLARGTIEDDLWQPSAQVGDNKIWFLARDHIITGHYFIRYIQPATESIIMEIEKLIDDTSNAK